MTHALAEPIRNYLLAATKTDKPCGVLLSNGVDSNSVLAALLRNGLRPSVISFRIANYVSTDWSAARRTAGALELPFIDIELSTDVEEIAKDVKFAIQQLGLRRKPDIECFVPIMHAIRTAKANGIVDLFTGAAADGYYALSAKGFKEAYYSNNLDNPDWMDEFREKYFARENPAQTKTAREYGATLGVNVLAPYVSQELLDIYRGASWRWLNRPSQKKPVRDAFPEMKRWRVGLTHQNLQLGDSGIADNFTRLVDSRFNPNGFKSTIGIYNSMVRNEV